MTVYLFKDGDRMGIQSDCLDEHSFVSELSQLLGDMISDDSSDWEFQLNQWLVHAFEIVAKLRGYKANVVVTRLVLAGTGAGVPLVASIDNHGHVVTSVRGPVAVADTVE